MLCAIHFEHHLATLIWLSSSWMSSKTFQKTRDLQPPDVVDLSILSMSAFTLNVTAV